MKIEDYIMKMCKKYNFYENEVMSMIVMWCMSGKPNTIQPKYLYHHEGKKKVKAGFFINMWSPHKILCVKFIFIQPKYRRMGIFTRFINVMKEKEFAISIDTDEKPMIEAIKKNGFVKKGMCHNNIEEWWGWSRNPDLDFKTGK